MSQYINRVIGRPKNIENIPFQIIQSGDKFYVSSGRCYSTYSYSYETLLPIQNLYSPIEIPQTELKDYCFYIDFTILPNQQISGGEIKATKVGKNLPSNSNDWVDYPNQYKIRPFDIKNTDGTIKTIIDDKRQEKAYVMLGKIWEDYPQIDPYPITTITGLDSNNQIKNYFLSNYMQNDIIVMGSNVSGVPVAIFLPYYGGPYWKTPEEY